MSSDIELAEAIGDDLPFGKKERGYIKSLQRRRDFLEKRARIPRPGGSYDEHEYHALRWILRKIGIVE